ncbi:hypothetical protein OG735_05165 [Streptomyces sp. NBC_01210]|nr:hypothetical protein OG735_05165 [Streptomyces sp. NBC_01210]
MAVKKVTDDEAELLALLRLPRRLDLPADHESHRVDHWPIDVSRSSGASCG